MLCDSFRNSSLIVKTRNLAFYIARFFVFILLLISTIIDIMRFAPTFLSAPNYDIMKVLNIGGSNVA